jgi:hypothetical protein
MECYALRIHNLLFVWRYLRVYPLKDVVNDQALANTAMTVVCDLEFGKKMNGSEKERTKLDSFIDFTNPL